MDKFQGRSYFDDNPDAIGRLYTGVMGFRSPNQWEILETARRRLGVAHPKTLIRMVMSRSIAGMSHPLTVEERTLLHAYHPTPDDTFAEDWDILAEDTLNYLIETRTEEAYEVVAKRYGVAVIEVRTAVEFHPSEPKYDHIDKDAMTDDDVRFITLEMVAETHADINSKGNYLEDAYFDTLAKWALGVKD